MMTPEVDMWFPGLFGLTLGAAIASSAPQTYVAPRTASGHPDLQGIWQVRNTANWDVQDHAGSHKTPAGLGVVVDPPDGSIPYLTSALEKKRANFANRDTEDPVEKCYLAGVPRTMYLPFPLQILQTESEVMIFSEYVHTYRWIPLGPLPRYEGYESWMGDSRGRWEGETLVVETTGFNDQTWFDRAGNFHSDALKTIERFTRTAADTITYEVVIEDAKVFARPWTMRMPLYLNRDMDRLLEYECHIYAEEVGKPIRGSHPPDR
jgi:hypothetical protein